MDSREDAPGGIEARAEAGWRVVHMFLVVLASDSYVWHAGTGKRGMCLTYLLSCGARRRTSGTRPAGYIYVPSGREASTESVRKRQKSSSDILSEYHTSMEVAENRGVTTTGKHGGGEF